MKKRIGVLEKQCECLGNRVISKMNELNVERNKKYEEKETFDIKIVFNDKLKSEKIEVDIANKMPVITIKTSDGSERAYIIDGKHIIDMNVMEKAINYNVDAKEVAKEIHNSMNNVVERNEKGEMIIDN